MILDSCGFAASLGMTILVERCLVTVDNGEIQMHDLLKAMGQSMVRDEYLKGNGIPSRIWREEDFMDILSEDRTLQERRAVKGIVLTLSRQQHFGGLVKYNAFKGFKKLRVLIVLNFVCIEEPVQLPCELRWLEWRTYYASSIELDPFNKLVGLCLWRSEIRQIKGMGFKELKYINLTACYLLETLPDLSKCWKLEYLILRCCSNLTRLDEAIGSLENLVRLDVSYCYKLMMVPSSLRSKRLQTLDFQDCYKIRKLPAIYEELPLLENLDLSYTTIMELPDSIGNLVALKKLNLCRCKELTTIPSSIYKMRALEVLELWGCRKLSGFPRRAAGTEMDVLGFPNLVSLDISYCKLRDLEFLNDLTCFETLKSLVLSGNEFTHVPASISKFKKLEELELFD